MRKDVKFGLTIGAILVVTLVIYVIVLSRGPSVPQRIGIVMPGQSSSQQNTSSGTTSESTDSTDATRTDAATPAAPDDSASGTNGSADTKTTPPAATPDLEASIPATQPTAAAPNTVNNDWEGALNHGPPISLAAPERTVTPSIDATPSSISRNGNTITRANVPMIDALPATQPSRPMFADVPALDAPANAMPAPSYTASTPEPTRSVSDRPRDLNSTPRTHRVASGESPYSISVAVYGSGKYFKRIMAANPGLDPRHLKIGQILVIPELNDSDKTASPAASNSSRVQQVNPNTAYVVASGDTLESISRKLYGTPAMMDKLFEANKSLMGDDENMLKIGWVLKLPEAPSAATAQR
jgi:nucleoid-associated protein YgaU